MAPAKLPRCPYLLVSDCSEWQQSWVIDICDVVLCVNMGKCCYLWPWWRVVFGGGGLSVCLSVSYIRPKSRTERPRKTKIGTEIAHVTRDSDTTFKVKRSKVKVTGPLYSPPCWRVMQLQQWAWERVRRGKLLLCCRLLRPPRVALRRPRGRRGAGAYCVGRPPSACLFFSALVRWQEGHWACSSLALAIPKVLFWGTLLDMEWPVEK